jgi:hypothetical protein
VAARGDVLRFLEAPILNRGLIPRLKVFFTLIFRPPGTKPVGFIIHLLHDSFLALVVNANAPYHILDVLALQLANRHVVLCRRGDGRSGWTIKGSCRETAPDDAPQRALPSMSDRG